MITADCKLLDSNTRVELLLLLGSDNDCAHAMVLWRLYWLCIAVEVVVVGVEVVEVVVVTM